MRSPVLVGRSAELAAAGQIVDAAAGGAGGALIVSGPAGIGKTRLLDVVAHRAAEAGLTVLAGRAVEGGGPYRPVAESLLGPLDRPELRDDPRLRPYRAALGRLLPGWAGTPETAAVDQAVLVGTGLLRLLAVAEPRGVLLRWEDLHWADADTLALVEHLAGAVAGVPVLLAVSLRDDAPSAAVRKLGSVAGATALPLRPLTPAEVADVAAACGVPVPPELAERSAGLPFLVEELLDGGGALPPTLAALVASRLAALPDPAQRVLHAAAVIGGDPDWTLLGSTAGVAEDAVLAALRSAVEHALLVADGSRLRWPHALTRDAVLAAVLPPDRAALARRAATELLCRDGPDDGLRAAELMLQGGQPDRAALQLLGLAREATRRGALRSAERLLARAGSRRADVVTERVAALLALGRVEDALMLGRDVLPSLMGDDHADLCLQLARVAVATGDWPGVEAWVERAGRPDDARSTVLLADAAFGAGAVGRARELAAAAVERATEPVVLCEALGVAGRALAQVDPVAMGAAHRRAARVAAEHGLGPLRVRAAGELAGYEAMRVGSPATLAALLAAREQVVEAGMLAYLASVDLVAGDHVLTIEGPAGALVLAREAAEIAGELGLAELAATARMELATFLGAAGDTAAMAAEIDAVAAPSREVAAHGSGARALAALLDHDLAAAAHHADAAMEFLLAHRSAPPLTWFGLWALVRTAAGDRDARAALAGHPAALRHANVGALGYADAIAAGSPDEAAARFAAADAELAGMPWWRRALRPTVLERALADGWGDPVPLLRADLAHHEDGGDARQARTCRDLLRRAGAPTRRRGRPVPPRLRALGVTGRELDVLELVAQGLTNAEVAARLYLSPRTVDTHVASLLAKTGSATRGELRALTR